MKKANTKKEKTYIFDIPCFVTGKSQYELLKKQFSEYEKWQIKETNYTSQFKNLANDKAYFLADDFSGQKVFIGSNKIKSDVINQRLYIDDIPNDCINYFSKKPELNFLENCFLIDIKNAYPTALKNNGVIKTETFEYLNNLKKIDRLKSIGALAVKKILKTYNKAKLIDLENIPRSKYANVYFFAAHTIGEVMQECKEKFNNVFLFYWFDGIYIKKDYSAACEISDFFTGKGYENRIYDLDYFLCEPTGVGKIKKIAWKENGKDEKKIYLPL